MIWRGHPELPVLSALAGQARPPWGPERDHPLSDVPAMASDRSHMPVTWLPRIVARTSDHPLSLGGVNMSLSPLNRGSRPPRFVEGIDDRPSIQDFTDRPACALPGVPQILLPDQGETA